MGRYPKPQLGYYTAECCLRCLYKIETSNDLRGAEDRIADNDECGELMVFRTLADAIAYLGDDFSGDEQAREFERLGWVPGNDA